MRLCSQSTLTNRGEGVSGTIFIRFFDNLICRDIIVNEKSLRKHWKMRFQLMSFLRTFTQYIDASS
ncbi:hypothetical protein CW706_04580 [Candidatus Bathyarchaeota archaeon]|nr:MAG: hypothetical protein CW706_04580 [Candidatus Bathyarchaeota archaeon]